MAARRVKNEGEREAREAEQAARAKAKKKAKFARLKAKKKAKREAQNRAAVNAANAGNYSDVTLRDCREIVSVFRRALYSVL